MRKPKKVYDDEFKETIRELYNTGKDVTMLSEEYGLPKSGFMSISWTQFFSFFTNIFSQIL